MHHRNSTRGLTLMAIGALWLALCVAPTRVLAQDSGRVIEGTWGVLVTLTNCATGAPLGLPPFRSLLTFERGGAILESTGSLAFAPNQRSLGHGRWTQLTQHRYAQHTVALILFDSNPQTVPPTFAGWQTIDHEITLTDADAFTSIGTTAFIDVNGQVYRQGCSTAVGQRFRG